MKGNYLFYKHRSQNGILYIGKLLSRAFIESLVLTKTM